MSKIVIDVEENFHKAVRIKAIEEGLTMKDFIVKTVLDVINPRSSNTKVDFNKELKVSMKENKSILKELADK
jgi:galactose-1-phosphate uridylyltransferase